MLNKDIANDECTTTNSKLELGKILNENALYEKLGIVFSKYNDLRQKLHDECAVEKAKAKCEKKCDCSPNPCDPCAKKPGHTGLSSSSKIPKQKPAPVCLPKCCCYSACADLAGLNGFIDIMGAEIEQLEAERYALQHLRCSPDERPMYENYTTLLEKLDEAWSAACDLQLELKKACAHERVCQPHPDATPYEGSVTISLPGNE